MLEQNKWFYFVNGRTASSIEELKDVIEAMSEGDFKHHVNNERNDFANWVEGVFEEHKLGKGLREVAEKDGMVIIIEDFLSEKKNEKKVLPPIEPPKPTKKTIIPKEKKLSLGTEKDLSEKEIKDLVNEAIDIFEKEKHISEERALERKEVKEAKEEKEEYLEIKPERKALQGESKEKEEVLPRHASKHDDLHHKFIVKEFIYGFIIGLIFGLVMLGVILNLKVT